MLVLRWIILANRVLKAAPRMLYFVNPYRCHCGRSCVSHWSANSTHYPLPVLIERLANRDLENTTWP